MPSLGVSSLDSGRSSERPPFLTALLVTYGSGQKKGGRRFSSGPHSHFTSAILTHSARRGSRALPLRNLPRTRDLIREMTGESPQIFHRQPNTAPGHSPRAVSASTNRRANSAPSTSMQTSALRRSAAIRRGPATVGDGLAAR